MSEQAYFTFKKISELNQITSFNQNDWFLISRQEEGETTNLQSYKCTYNNLSTSLHDSLGINNETVNNLIECSVDGSRRMLEPIGYAIQTTLTSLSNTYLDKKTLNTQNIKSLITFNKVPDIPDANLENDDLSQAVNLNILNTSLTSLKDSLENTLCSELPISEDPNKNPPNIIFKSNNIGNNFIFIKISSDGLYQFIFEPTNGMGSVFYNINPTGLSGIISGPTKGDNDGKTYGNNNLVDEIAIYAGCTECYGGDTFPSNTGIYDIKTKYVTYLSNKTHLWLVQLVSNFYRLNSMYFYCGKYSDNKNNTSNLCFSIKSVNQTAIFPLKKGTGIYITYWKSISSDMLIPPSNTSTQFPSNFIVIVRKVS